jgi:hypothetical protein
MTVKKTKQTAKKIETVRHEYIAEPASTLPRTPRPYSGAAGEKYRALHALGDKRGILQVNEDARLACYWGKAEIDRLRLLLAESQEDQRFLLSQCGRLHQVLESIRTSIEIAENANE